MDPSSEKNCLRSRRWFFGERQPPNQASSRYPSYQRRRIFPTSLTGDLTPEIAEDDWERGWGKERNFEDEVVAHGGWTVS